MKDNRFDEGTFTIVYVPRYGKIKGDVFPVADYFNRKDAEEAFNRLSATIENAGNTFGKFKMLSFVNGKNSVYESHRRKGSIVESIARRAQKYMEE